MLRALLLLLAIAPFVTASRPELRRMLDKTPRMHAERVPLDHTDPSRTRVGALTYLGGVVLTSPDPAFGGFSAMQVAGDRFTLVSDGGAVVRFWMGADWQPREIAFSDLPGGPGSGAEKYERDAESLAWDPASGKIWVGFEGANQIWRYSPGLNAVEATARPRAMRRWSANSGPEAMARLANGQFIVLNEGRVGSGEGVAGIWFTRDPTLVPRAAMRFRYRPPPGYDVSDAAQLPDGRLLVLQRRLDLAQLFTAKLSIVDLTEVRPDKIVGGTEIATLAAPLLHDNFEALAVTREGADTILWIASDDNSQFWERSLLLKFKLAARPPTRKTRSP